MITYQCEIYKNPEITTHTGADNFITKIVILYGIVLKPKATITFNYNITIMTIYYTYMQLFLRLSFRIQEQKYRKYVFSIKKEEKIEKNRL